MGESVVDTEARSKVAVVKQQIDDHEKHCSERWGDAKKVWTSVDEKLDKNTNMLHSRINRVEKLILGSALSIAAFAIVQWLVTSGLITIK